MKNAFPLLAMFLLSVPSFAATVQAVNCFNGDETFETDPRPAVRAMVSAWKQQDSFLGVRVDGNADALAESFFENGSFNNAGISVSDWVNLEGTQNVRVIQGVGGRRACLVKSGTAVR